MRTDVLVGLLIGGALGCLGERTPAAFPDAAPADGGAILRPLGQPITVQAAFNDATFFLLVRWVGGAIAPTLSVALSSRAPATAVRTFAASGCFLACHDASTEMPNWLPEDGRRGMHLLSGFGGPADLWWWQAQPGNPSGRATASALGSDGGSDGPDAGTGGLAATASFADGAWNVTYVRALTAGAPGSVALTAGARYDLGFALHPDGVTGRHHYVSLPVALDLGGTATALVAVPLPPGGAPNFADTASFPPLALDLFLPGVTSYEFLVGAVVDRSGHLRSDDYRHGGAEAVATGALGCGDCHRVRSEGRLPATQNAGALERLVLRRGGVTGPPAVGVAP